MDRLPESIIPYRQFTGLLDLNLDARPLYAEVIVTSLRRPRAHGVLLTIQGQSAGCATGQRLWASRPFVDEVVKTGRFRVTVLQESNESPE